LHIKTETKVGLFVIVALGILAYMLFQLGVFRFNIRQYKSYEVYFEDVSGLTEKSDIKIAGVRVGWIEKISLLKDMQARIFMMVNGRYQLHSDAYAMIRQEGLLGARYIEIMTGNPEQPIVPPGSLLSRPGEMPVSMESLMAQFKDIAENVKQVSSSVCAAFGNNEQREKMQLLVDNLSSTSQNMNSLSESLNRIAGNNELRVSEIVNDIKTIACDIKYAVPEIKKSIDHLSFRLDNEVLPAFQGSIEKIANVFDRDFGVVANKLERTATTVEHMVNDARDGISSLKKVASKVDGGQGLLGKLIHDETVYNDIKSVTCSVRDSIKKFDDVRVEVDAHGESMMKPTDCYCHSNNKGYMNLRFYMTPSWFYNLQLVTSEVGWPERVYRHDTYLNNCCQVMDPADIKLDDGNIKVAPNVDSLCIKRNDARIDIQVGKLFDSGIALRAGSFEGTFGLAVDYTLPIYSDILNWVMSLEAFDLYGRNRVLCDRRPHLKWINSLYLFKNIYLTVGADDFVSKYNKNFFFGLGLCFSDDDLKHVASKLGSFGTH